MMPSIAAIFFDIGDTLRERVPDPTLQAQASEALLAFIQPSEPPEIFFNRLQQAYREYIQWRQETFIEISETELWTRWLLRDYPPDRIAPLAERLTHLYRLRGGRAVWRPDAVRVVRELCARGYVLGIISNTISSCETPQALADADLAQLFSAVVLSITFGKRKPDPAIFLHAARLANVSPNLCAYVGDRPSRDVVGSRLAGFAMSIIVAGTEHPDESEANIPKPDLAICELCELLKIFPEKKK